LFFQLLTGATAIDPPLTAIEMMVCVIKGSFPETQDFVAGPIGTLISSAWGSKPEDHQIFDDIFGQLDVMEFKITRDVDPNGIKQYVEDIKEDEARMRWHQEHLTIEDEEEETLLLTGSRRESLAELPRMPSEWSVKWELCTEP
jgi:hypothetical protein